MSAGSLPAGVKRTSALRRLPPLHEIRLGPERAGEGDVCAFELPPDSVPITVESDAATNGATADGRVPLAVLGIP